MAKLTDANVAEMRRIRAAEGLSYEALGRMFEIGRGAARNACLGLTWAHVPMPD